MKNGSAKVQEINTNLIQKIYGSNESEISFEEEPRTAVYKPEYNPHNLLTIVIFRKTMTITFLQKQLKKKKF